jgi:hypothetical protein
MTVTTLPTGNADAVAANVNKLAAEGANILAVKAAALATVAKIGEMAAEGTLALTDLAVKFAEWVRDPQHPFSEDDAGEVYATYANAHNARLDKSTYAKQGERLDADSKASKSTFKTFGKLAVAKYGPTWFEIVAVATGEHNAKLGKGDTRLSVYNGIARCNRGLGDAWETASKTETDFADWCKRTVTPVQIAAWLIGKPKVAKDDMTVLLQMVQNLETVAARESLSLALRQHMAAEIESIKKVLKKAEAGTLKVRTEVLKDGGVLTPGEIKKGLAA